MALGVALALAVAIGAPSTAMAVVYDVTVPSVIGQQKSAARVALQAEGLKSANKMVSSSLPAESVVATDPAAGTVVPAGAQVIVYW